MMSDAVHLHSFKETTTDTVTAAVKAFQNGAPHGALFLVLANREIAILRSRDAAVSLNPAAAPRIPAETFIKVWLEEGEHLNFILGAGETDGEIKVTRL